MVDDFIEECNMVVIVLQQGGGDRGDALEELREDPELPSSYSLLASSNRTRLRRHALGDNLLLELGLLGLVAYLRLGGDFPFARDFLGARGDLLFFDALTLSWLSFFTTDFS